MVSRPSAGFPLLGTELSLVATGSGLTVAVEEGVVLEALLSVLDGADEEASDEAGLLPKGDARLLLEDSEEAAPKMEAALLVELVPLKTDPEEEVGTLEVANEMLVVKEGVIVEEVAEEEDPPKEKPPLGTFPKAETPGKAGDPPPKMEVAELVVTSLACAALVPLVIGAGELVFERDNAEKGELFPFSTLESGVEDLEPEEASSLLMISTISGVADLAFSSFGVGVEDAKPPNPPLELFTGVTEKPPTEAAVPKPNEGWTGAAALEPKAGLGGAGLEPNASFARAGLDEAAGVVGAKPGKAGFAVIGFSGFGSAGEIGSYVGGLVGVTSVLVVT